MRRYRLIARSWAVGLGGVLVLALAAELAGGPGANVAHAYRWMVTAAAGERSIAPPLALMWQRSPIWFERWNPGGLSESPSRRLAGTGTGLVTVFRKKLHLLDRRTGRTLWTLPLQGEEIFDWKVADTRMVYASYGHDEAEQRYWGIRATVDVQRGRHLWTQTRPTPYLRKEWLVIHGQTVVFGDDEGNELTALSLEDGAPRWKNRQQAGDDYTVQASWFARGDRLYALAGREGHGGLFLKAFEIATGRERPLTHLVGNDAISNLHAPSAVTTDGRLFVEYHAFRREDSWLVAYDMEADRLLWQTQVVRASESRGRELLSGRNVALGRMPGDPLLATYRPHRYLVLNPATGAVVNGGVVPGYVGWTEHNAVLYSYPYLFTSARRAVGAGEAYDLIALNLQTGKVEWSYEIERQNERISTASAEILNFLIEGREIYVGRTDARVMAFRSPEPGAQLER